MHRDKDAIEVIQLSEIPSKQHQRSQLPLVTVLGLSQVADFVGHA